MILQMVDSFGRINIFGVGAICCKNGEPPVIFSKVNNTAKATFTITTGVSKNKNTEQYHYQNIPCAVYGRQFNKEIFALLETVKQWDKVIFCGIYYCKKAINKTNGQEINFSEVRVEYLQLCSMAIPVNTQVRKLKSEKDVEKAVKGATNRQKREKDYF